MKKILILIMTFALSLNLFAQESTENKPESKQETLISSENMTLGVYGGPEFKFTNINGELGFMSGGRGGLVIGKVFTIGGGGYGLSTNHKLKLINNLNQPQEYNIDAGWGGLFIEFVNKPNDLIHFSVNSLIGGGKASLTEQRFFSNEWDDYDFDRSSFFVFEPGVNVEFNIATFLRLSMGGSYRIVAGLNMKGLENSDLGGYSANVMLKFGLDDFHVINKIIDDVKRSVD